jgi:HAMP domain-containing protein
MATAMNSISGLVRRATVLVFAFALIIGSATFYLFFNAATMKHVEDEARTLLSLAMASRNYTIENITPLLAQLPDDDFHAEQVPSFAAQKLFRNIVSEESDYTYREAALNPTNPRDQANNFEAGLIANFRRDADFMEAQGIRRTDGSATFYIARPITISNPACLACHSTPEAAPRAMVQQYGDRNGFGWNMGETIGIQILTVPVDDEFRSIYELVAIFFVMLVALFLVVSLMVTLPLQRNVIQPLRKLADIADRSSLRGDDTSLPKSGAGEIQQLSDAISRLRSSLKVSMDKPDSSK